MHAPSTCAIDAQLPIESLSPDGGIRLNKKSPYQDIVEISAGEISIIIPPLTVSVEQTTSR